MLCDDREDMSVAANISRIEARIADAARRAGRDPAEIMLLAVSKTIPAAVVREAVVFGQYAFGESYVQEAQRKREELTKLLSQSGVQGVGRIRFDLIGALQRNKVKHAVGLFDVIQSVDRRELAAEISSVAVKRGVEQKVLMQINISREASKSGVLPEHARELAEDILRLPNIVLMGLMSIGSFLPENEPEAVRRREFCELARLQCVLAEQTGSAMPELSMGMSSDFELAIAEGATIVRVGTALFGER